MMSLSWIGRLVSLAGLVVIALIATACGTSKVAVDDGDLKAARLLEEGRVQESLIQFSKALRGNPYDFTALLGIATCNARLGRAALFEEAALRAASAAPRTPEGWNEVGRVYVLGAERFRETGRARIYAELGVGYLRQVFATEPADPGLIENLGIGLFLKEDLRAARYFLGAAFEKNPTRPAVADAYLRVLRDLGDHSTVRQVLDRVEAETGERPATWSALRAWAEAGKKSDSDPGKSSVKP